MRLFFLKIAILNLEISAVVCRTDTHFLDGFAFQPLGKWDPDLATGMKFREITAHWHRQESVLNVDGIGGQDQVEHTAFLAVMRHPDVLETVFALLGFLYEVEERLETSVCYFERLLGDSSLQQPVVLVLLADMVVLFVLQELLLMEVILPNIIESHVVQVVAVPAHFAKDGIFFFRKVAYDI